MADAVARQKLVAQDGIKERIASRAQTQLTTDTATGGLRVHEVGTATVQGAATAPVYVAATSNTQTSALAVVQGFFTAVGNMQFQLHQDYQGSFRSHLNVT